MNEKLKEDILILLQDLIYSADRFAFKYGTENMDIEETLQQMINLKISATDIVTSIHNLENQ